MIDDDTAKAYLAANLSRLLKDRGLTQTQLAEMTDQYHSLISRVVNGHNMPGGTVLARIAEALDVSIDRLLAPPPEKTLADSRNRP